MNRASPDAGSEFDTLPPSERMLNKPFNSLP
jgi:hypothetical protein